MMKEFEEEYRWAQKGWADCRITLDTTRRAMEIAQKESQRWQAHSVLVEDQRDAAIAERDEAQAFLGNTQRLLEASQREAKAHVQAVIGLEVERGALREQLDDLQAGMRQWEDEHASALASVIAERDELRKQLDDMKADYRDGSYWGRQ